MQHYLNPFITNLFPVRQYSSWLLYSAYEQKKPPTQSLPMAWHSWHVPGNFSLSTAYRHTQVYKCLVTKKPIISPTYLTGLSFSLIVGEIHSYHFRIFIIITATIITITVLISIGLERRRWRWRRKNPVNLRNGKSGMVTWVS